MDYKIVDYCTLFYADRKTRQVTPVNVRRGLVLMEFVEAGSTQVLIQDAMSNEQLILPYFHIVKIAHPDSVEALFKSLQINLFPDRVKTIFNTYEILEAQYPSVMNLQVNPERYPSLFFGTENGIIDIDDDDRVMIKVANKFDLENPEDYLECFAADAVKLVEYLNSRSTHKTYWVTGVIGQEIVDSCNEDNHSTQKVTTSTNKT